MRPLPKAPCFELSPVRQLLQLSSMHKRGIGHQGPQKQTSLFKTHWKYRYSHGGILRNKRAGRKARPLSSKDPLHLVFKLNRHRLRHFSLRSPRGYSLTLQILKKYSKHFAVKVEQVSIQNDHIHLLVRTSRRSRFQNFFRVVAGQMAQRFKKEGLLRFEGGRVTGTPSGSRGGVTGLVSLWKYRPFTRVVKGWRAYKTVQNYIQLNEQEVLGRIPYQKQRLRGLSEYDWLKLWS